MNTPVNPASVAASPFYSQGIAVSDVSRMLFISGQVGMDAEGNVPEGVAEQAGLASRNLRAVLEEAGMTVGDMTKVTIYLTDAADVPAFLEGAAGFLPSPPPATTMLIIAGLADPRLRVEIEAIAVGSS